MKESTNAANTLTFLHNVAGFFQDNTLKSHYNTKYCMVALHGGSNVPAKFKDVLARCSKCMIERNRDTTSCRLNAETKHSRFARRLLGKKAKLTKYQGKYEKGIKAKDENLLVLTCKICGHKDEKRLRKPVTKPEVSEPVPTQTKKKKRKDKLSGLNASAVLSASKVTEQKKPDRSQTEPNEITNKKNIIYGRNQFGSREPRKGRLEVTRDRVLKNKEKKKAREKSNKLSSLLNSKVSKKSGLKQFLDSML